MIKVKRGSKEPLFLVFLAVLFIDREAFLT